MSVQTKPTLVLGRPRFLLEGVYLRSVLALSYEVSADGQRSIIEIGSRRVHSAGCTAYPDEAWVKQQTGRSLGDSLSGRSLFGF